MLARPRPRSFADSAVQTFRTRAVEKIPNVNFCVRLNPKKSCDAFSMNFHIHVHQFSCALLRAYLQPRPSFAPLVVKEPLHSLWQKCRGSGNFGKEWSAVKTSNRPHRPRADSLPAFTDDRQDERRLSSLPIALSGVSAVLVARSKF